MDVLHHPIPHPLKVLPHPPFRFLRVFLAHGFDDPAMIGQGGFHAVRNPPGGETEHANMVEKQRYEFHKPAGVGEKNDGLMKLEVLPGITLDVLLLEGFLKAFHAGFQLRQAGRGDLLRRQAGGQPFQVLPNEEKLVHVFFGELDDEGPPLGKDLHQPFLLQPVDGLPDGSPADPQGFGQLPFVQLFPGADLSLQDDPSQLLVGLASERKVGGLDLLHRASESASRIFV